LYASLGSFDTNCTEKLSLGTLKTILTTAVILPLRTTIMSEFDEAWQTLSSTNNEVLQYTAKMHERKEMGDPDDFKIPFKYFQKIMKDPSFSKYFEIATVFGKRGTCYC
jgi:hypothetical protein